MKLFSNYIITIAIICTLTISSCRYSIPLLKHKINSDTIVKNDTKKITEKYLYFRISRYGFRGEFNYSRTFTKDNLDSITIFKFSSHRSMKDGVHTTILKTILYSNDNKKQINLKLTKGCCKGFCWKKVHKTIYCDGYLPRKKIVKKETRLTGSED